MIGGEQGVFRNRKAKTSCDVSEGPFCGGFETLGDGEEDGHAQLRKRFDKVLTRNTALNKKSNDQGKRQVGIMVVESQALFLLSFTTFDSLSARTENLTEAVNFAKDRNETTTAEKELRFEQDQLSDRVMVKEMGKGVRDIELSFENPITVS